MKNKKFLIIISVLIVFCILIILIINGDKKTEEHKTFGFMDIVDEINLALPENTFSPILDMQILRYIPLSNTDNLFLAVNSSNEKEYFLIGRNLNNEQRAQLESMYSYEDEDSSVFYSDDKYVYFIKSEQNLYMIEGIINSFIYNY